LIIIRNVEQQISILERFVKDHVTLKWSNDVENSALQMATQEYIIFPVRKQLF